LNWNRKKQSFYTAEKFSLPCSVIPPSNDELAFFSINAKKKKTIKIKRKNIYLHLINPLTLLTYLISALILNELCSASR
jgi:hypothetical protein